MIGLEIKNGNTISTKEQQKDQRYHQVKLINIYEYLVDEEILLDIFM